MIGWALVFCKKKQLSTNFLVGSCFVCCIPKKGEARDL